MMTALPKRPALTLQSMPAEVLNLIGQEVFGDATIELVSPLALTDPKMLALTETGTTVLLVHQLLGRFPLADLL